MSDTQMRCITSKNAADYRQYLLREERAPATVAKYMQELRFFAAWAGQQPVTKECVTGWKEHLVAQGHSPATVNGKLSALNGFFAFMGWADCRAKFMRVQRRVFRAREKELSRKEYERLLTAAQNKGQTRLLLLMETICATGIRVSEVEYITVEAVQKRRAEIALKGKLRTVLLPDKLCEKLRKYAHRHGISSGYIFRTANGRRIGRCQIWAEMKRLCKAAGVSAGKVFPHNLRHLFARTFYDACKDIVKLADVLGHSSIETTRIYLISTGEEHARQIERLGLIH